MAQDNHFDMKSLEKLQRTIEYLLRNLTDLRVHQEPLKESFHETEREQFTTLGGLTGGWEPLSPWYQAWKDRRYPGLPMMVMSGRMMRSLTSDSPDSIFNVLKDRLEVGTKLEYAHEHQYGDPQRPNLPIRPVIPEEIALERLAKAWQASVLKTLGDAP